MTMVAAPVVANDPSTQRSTVFVVDDDPSIRKSLRWLVESVGMNVETFGGANEFLASYRPTNTGCIVMDVRMPEMGGLELQERLRERGCRLPVIVITSFGDVPMAVRAMKSGAVQFYEKPINNQMLLEQIQLCVAEDLRRMQSETSRRQTEERFKRLTPREAQVLAEVVAGYSSKEIGQHLNVSFKTIEAHRAKIMRKMEADSVPHLIRMYLDLPPEQRVAAGSDEPGDSDE